MTSEVVSTATAAPAGQEAYCIAGFNAEIVVVDCTIKKPKDKMYSCKCKLKSQFYLKFTSWNLELVVNASIIKKQFETLKSLHLY